MHDSELRILHEMTININKVSMFFYTELNFQITLIFVENILDYSEVPVDYLRNYFFFKQFEKSTLGNL